jgi:hypothetical protein
MVHLRQRSSSAFSRARHDGPKRNACGQRLPGERQRDLWFGIKCWVLFSTGQPLFGRVRRYMQWVVMRFVTDSVVTATMPLSIFPTAPSVAS